MNFVSNLILATVRMAIPLLFIALGELYSERAGMVNIGLEGLAAIGSLIGFLICFITGSTWLGILCGALAGVLVNMIYAFATITLCANHTVYGMAMNIFAPALASFIYRVYFGKGSDLSQITLMQGIGIPVLKDIPFIGPLLFNQTPMVYIAFILVILTSIPRLCRLRGSRGRGRRIPDHLLLQHLYRGEYRRARLHRPRSGHLRALECKRNPDRLPLLRILRRSADPPAGSQRQYSLPVLPDDSLRGDRYCAFDHRKPPARSQGRGQALQERRAVIRSF